MIAKSKIAEFLMAAVPYNDWLYEPSVTARDRLSFSLFLAAILHAVVILGITFTFLERGASSHTMEVTLAQHRSTSAPSKADYLAQFDQQGSGTLEDKKMITATHQSPFHDTTVRDTTRLSSALTTPETQSEQVVTSTQPSSSKVFKEKQEKEQRLTESTEALDKTILQKSMEIASLEARLDELRQIHAKRPRIKRLTSLSTKSSVDAYYLNSWRRKIETIGNLNYPEEARKRKIFGSLRLMVAILPNGTVKEIEVLESSGHRFLDNAAIRIVKLASPYAPFPKELRQNTDVLEIIRTWQFRKNSSLRSF